MSLSLVGEGQSNCTTRLVTTIVALTAVVAIALGVLAILANHGYHLGSLEGIGTIAGGSLVGLGVLIPIAVLGVRSCQNSSAPASELKPEVSIAIVTEPDSRISKKANAFDIPKQHDKQVNAVLVWWLDRNVFRRF